MSEAKDPRLTRSHIIHAGRLKQLRLNQLAINGGSAYIAQRLSRLPFESDVSWNGISKKGQTEGRQSRAFLINYAARICAKINQYVFSTEVKREKIDPVFHSDATRTGMSINDLMRQVSTTITACRWCWLGIDRNSLPLEVDNSNPRSRSQAAKEASGDRIYWTYWHPSEVVDWHFGEDGKLEWLITEQNVYKNTDIEKPAVNQPLRTIWKRGGGTRLWLKPEEPEKIEREEDFHISANIVPFVLGGLPSADAWWFDDVEAIQASLLNLDSVHNESLFQSVYPQLILPADMLAMITDALKISGEAALELVRGLNYPILEPIEANGQARYIMPPSDGMKTIPDEIIRRRKELFDIVGLAMKNPDSRMVESAEAKQWDQLDPEAVLKERAVLLQETEQKAVAISRQLDNTFPEYAPEYGKAFNVSDLTEDMTTLAELGKMGLPQSGQKEIQKAAIQILDKLVGIDEKTKAKINAEISAGGGSACGGDAMDKETSRIVPLQEQKGLPSAQGG